MTGIWTAVLLAALCATALAWAAALLHERGLRPLRRVAAALRCPTWGTAFLAAVAVGFIHHGATKGTNGLDQGSIPVEGCGLSVPSAQLDADGFLPTRNPEPAALNPQPSTNLDWLAFGGYEDWFRIPEGGWCFRLGSNLLERVTVRSCGDVYANLRDASNRISVLGLPLSIVPAANWHMIGNGEQGTGNYQLPTTNYQLESLFWHAVTPSNSLLLTWENALVNRDTNLPVTVQAELFPDGAAMFRYDFSGLADTDILSNAAVRIWRDGAVDEVPLQPDMVAEVAFPAPPVTGTNTLDEVYARTTTKLTVTAYGGENGGTLSLSVVGGLDICAGQSGLPATIGAGESIEWNAYYEGVAASASQGGAVATVTFTDNETGRTIDDTANATEVEITVTPMVEAPENNLPGRHKLGVCEIVSCQQSPAFPQVTWIANVGTMRWDNDSLYYDGPLYATSNPIQATIGDVCCTPLLTIVEPQGVEARNMSSIEYGLHPGIAGYVGMQFTLFILPSDVSFEQIAVEEVPCNTGSHTGYFALPAFSNSWSHTRANGAGEWADIQFGNEFGIDEATYTQSIPKSYLTGLNGGPVLGWYDGYLSWDVPYGWNVTNTTGTASEFGQFATDTQQEFLIDAEGTVTIMKLNSWISRSTNDVIMLYGDIR